MSWLRNALNKASEVAGVGSAATAKATVLNASAKGNYLAGRVKQYAGVVVQRAGDVMAGGAKMVMERTGTAKNLNNLKHAVRRLDEVSRSASGKERTEALTRWLGALRELGRGGRLATIVPGSPRMNVQKDAGDTELSIQPTASDRADSEGSSEASAGKGLSLLEPTGSKEGELQPSHSHVASSVLFYDVESGDEPFTFRDVFLRSNALENIVVSLVKEPPTSHDTELVLELLDLCMMGDSHMHAAFFKAIVDLSQVFSSYAEVKLSQDELLQMVATAVTGMKFNSEAERLEALASRLKRQLDHLDMTYPSAIPDAFSLSLKLADATRQLEAIVLQQGDDATRRKAKIDTSKTLSSDLLSKLSDFENRIRECEQQLQDSGKFRSSKAEEVFSSEKVIVEELQVLHKRRVQLEEELAQVMGAIGAATRRHLEIQEEKEQFDLVSDSIASRLSVEEEGLHVMMRQHKDDAKVFDEWKVFLEDTWKMQLGSREDSEREAKEGGADAQKRLWKIAQQHLGGLKGEVLRCWEQFKTERAKLEESIAYGDTTGTPETARGLPADEGFRIAEFRLKNSLREVEKVKAEIAVRTGGMANPGGENKEYFEAIQRVISEIDELRREYSSMPKLRVRPEAIAEQSPAS